MSTTALPPDSPIDQAGGGRVDLRTALDGATIGEPIVPGLDLLTSLAHFRSSVGRMTKHTPTNGKGKTSTNNSYDTNIKPQFFQVPPLFLTNGLLRQARISEGGQAILKALSVAQTMSDWKENTVSKDIMHPLFNLFLDVFSFGNTVDGQLKWFARVDDKRDEGGDIDVKLSMTEGEGRPPVAKATVEMKTTKAIGDGVAERVTSELVGHAEDVWKTRRPQDTFVHSALAWAPAHFIPLLYNGTLTIGKDLVGSKKKFPDVVTCPESWPKFFDIVGAWIFMVLISVDEDLCQMWEELCPEQVEQAQQFAVGKALTSNSRWSALTRFGAAALYAIQQASLRVVMMAIRTNRFRTLTIKCYDTLIVNPSCYYRLPLGLTLPDPSRTASSSSALSLIYSLPNIVVKIFNDMQCYARECVAYDKLKHLQGYGIPILYASGHCAGDGSPFLVISNEGESLDQLTELERAALKPLIKRMHDAHIHHHDLHLRNVVRGKRRKLRIIDFGASELNCQVSGCTDEWKEDWES